MTAPALSGPRTDPAGINEVLNAVELPCHVVQTPAGVALTHVLPARGARPVLSLAPLPATRLGDPGFRTAHGVTYALMAGAMAGGIASPELVTAMARHGYLAAYGSGGVAPSRIEQALHHLAAHAAGLPYAVNLLHAPHEPAVERAVVDLCLRHGVRCVEASAFMNLTAPLVHYRLASLHRRPDGSVAAANRVIAKVSRPEVAERFLTPADPAIVTALADAGLISAEQAALAAYVPMADDVTVEADSGGHTDGRPLAVLLPALAGLRDALRQRHPGLAQVRLGAAGGIGTPAAVHAAFALGADYVVTGSVNQACREAGTSAQTRRMLAAAGIADVGLAPSADMFEFGSRVQVLKRGTMFAQRAGRLHRCYERYDSLEALPAEEREWLETVVLRRTIADVWEDVVEFFTRRDPAQLEAAQADPRRRMALLFRWYLGLSSRWASTGDAERTVDYQIWCGPAMGAFNQWAAGTYLAAPENRSVVDVSHHLLRGAAVAARVHQLRLAGVRLPQPATAYRVLPVG
ncbi:2-nitropropane dioxygenase [Catellatospora sp. IY07-71]|uniref:PfaD family polyunsaturated fatty acid/polyketide biosynthesis protein n=1 Tax=Catellatospora sp. IY07-71 TaxID=2728827 RepID=UPI001BB32F21|nr:PfaD family polyunsaturated fatty acid/polyketide biosynthesis protein [Catellatospora sp. IY07-71]BCJ73673.1 2-nitropropane dioxygenase [Catellatospora sp. IY07-71]